jgi:competence protein CoiA
MQYATYRGERIEAEATGDRASCPVCGAMVLAKCGQIVVHHWAHEAAGDCDPWAEPDTAWHRHWQEAAPEDRREVTRGPHRADVVTASGMVVELQHSSISVEEIAAREAFYGRMTWLFDAADAYEQDRLDIRWRDYRSRSAGPYIRGVSFRWKHPRKSVAWCERPVLLDLGNGLVLWLRRFDAVSPPYGGWGWLYAEDYVRSWMGERVMVPWRG